MTTTMSPPKQTSQPTGRVTFARAAMLGLALLFVAGAFVQFFLAGLGLFDDAARWEDHKSSGHVLGLVTYFIWIPAALGRVGAGTLVGAILLVPLYYAQYAFIHIENTVVNAFHPVNGTVLLLLAFWIALRAFSLLRRSPERALLSSSE
jgi:hypothetical protein